MFESSQRLVGEIEGLLDAIRGVAESRYTCLLEPKGIVFESHQTEGDDTSELRRLLEEKCGALFSLPGSLAAGGPAEDVFSGWDRDDFFLAFINRRVALVVACADPERAQEKALEPLRALADRLFRYKETYRFDPQGRGFFFGSPQLDLVVVGRASDGRPE
jgi:hypothetical protein